jgi:catechol 2,3-dioxygenase
VHLHVGDLKRGLGFYRDVLGFELMAFMPGAAAFVAAGGYQYHLGLNVWRGEVVSSAPPGRVGLCHWTVVLAEHEQVAAIGERVSAAGIPTEERAGDEAGGFLVRDPWGNAVLLVTPEVLATRAEGMS